MSEVSVPAIGLDDSSPKSRVLVADESALFFHLHSGNSSLEAVPVHEFSLLEGYASSSWELSNFNTQHPMFGGEPISVLTSERSLRMNKSDVSVRLCTSQLPAWSAMRLNERLFVASPELVLARMASGRSEACIAEIATNLCARYYLSVPGESIEDRLRFLTTPDRLDEYLASASGLRGSKKARQALHWVLANSGSPMETKMAVLFRMPLGKGGFALPFDALNYDIKARGYSRLCEQGLYCVDMVCRSRKVGMEYDGREYHLDASHDVRRRNALLSMGWEVFPLDKGILFDAEATEKLGHQVAKRMGVRLQKPKSWESNYAQLRKDLCLPA